MSATTGTITLTQMLKDRYDRRAVYGTYAQLCLFVERQRYELRRGRYLDPNAYHELARSMGLEVAPESRFHALMYRENPLFSFAGPRKPLPHLRLDDGVVTATQRSRSQQ